MYGSGARGGLAVDGNNCHTSGLVEDSQFLQIELKGKLTIFHFSCLIHQILE
jgi:hypothetical protein